MTISLSFYLKMANLVIQANNKEISSRNVYIPGLTLWGGLQTEKRTIWVTRHLTWLPMVLFMIRYMDIYNVLLQGRISAGKICFHIPAESKRVHNKGIAVLHAMNREDFSTDEGCIYIQYIPRNMHTVFALLCFVVVIHWLIFPYPWGLLHWHCGNLTIAPVPAKRPWWIWINTSCEFSMNDCITTTKQSTTKLCAYFLGYTVYNIYIYICHRYYSSHKESCIAYSFHTKLWLFGLFGLWLNP